ncbi:S-locus glycoprotein domain [Dillenia turbinata]|uniref:Receptor-like serine/threonine-protein kinase n=1 Tax=Dillenia turbinata TaxID=194707 RepID=A0AAN8V683_9MAGN
MSLLLVFLVLPLLSCSISLSSSAELHSLNKRSYLSPEKPEDHLVSPNRVFSSGFLPVGENAYCFAIWFNNPASSEPHKPIWIANRNQPVNGKLSKLSISNSGNVILTDAEQSIVWSSCSSSLLPVRLSINDKGNLVLRSSENVTLWQSFDSPTDTLLPNQPFTRHTTLVSFRSESNYSNGFYKLYFDNDNVLRLLYDSADVSSIYWPDPWLLTWDTGRSTYNNSKIAMFDDFGYFVSSDHLEFFASDYGVGVRRRLTLDTDGVLRMYSLEGKSGRWVVSWQAQPDPCRAHGVCGPNSLCDYYHGSGRRCSCIPGFKMVNAMDWSSGCEPEQRPICNDDISKVKFVRQNHVEFFGFDYDYYPNYTLESCKKICLESCTCKGFLYKLENGVYKCHLKSLMINGKHSPNLLGTIYAKIKLSTSSNRVKENKLECFGQATHKLNRTYEKKHESDVVNALLYFGCAIGGTEIVCIISVCLFLSRKQEGSGAAERGYLVAATGHRRFTFEELKKATKGFCEEIGKGGSGIVYKGMLPSHGVVAVKRLDEASIAEDVFLAEVSTIGRLNHMNLINMLGYCAEGKHRLFVYDYMQNGSLADNLSSNALDWDKRFKIAVGTARGLAYLHEECLEWILHCDVKPQNILLDSNYQPKVADFGLSKLLSKGGMNNSGFSRIRGTEGYMAPEWFSNQSISSKVDVYSYGIAMLEMVTGKNPTSIFAFDDREDAKKMSLVTWVREKLETGVSASSLRMEDVFDPAVDAYYDVKKIEILVKVALQCVEENKDARPTMRKVVDMLLLDENEK